MVPPPARFAGFSNKTEEFAVNILLINHYAGSPSLGMEYRPYYLAREWTRKGHHVTIVAASFSHVRTVAPRVCGKVTDEDIDGIRYIWLRTPAYQGNGLARAINMFSFVHRLRRLAPKLAREIHPNVVIASSTYPLDIYPAHDLARKSGARLIFEVHDLWPLSPMELGGMSRRHPFIMLMQRAEDYAYRHADRVVSMLPLAEEHMRSHGLSEGKFIYIPNGIDIAEWQREASPLPQTHADVLADCRKQGKFIVGYAGAHGLANSLETVIDAAAILADDSAEFVLVGQGPQRESLIRKTTKLGLKNVHLLPPIPKESIPTFLRAADALFVGLQRQSLFRFGVSPNKLIDYMMSGKPVIQAIEAGNDLVSESGCGLTIPPQDPRALAEAVRKMMNMTSSEREAMGARGRNYVLSKHTYEVLAQRFESVFT